MVKGSLVVTDCCSLTLSRGTAYVHVRAEVVTYTGWHACYQFNEARMPGWCVPAGRTTIDQSAGEMTVAYARPVGPGHGCERARIERVQAAQLRRPIRRRSPASSVSFHSTLQAQAISGRRPIEIKAGAVIPAPCVAGPTRPGQVSPGRGHACSVQSDQFPMAFLLLPAISP
jgi:hypothetical protein